MEVLQQIDRRAWAASRPNKPADLDEASIRRVLRGVVGQLQPGLQQTVGIALDLPASVGLHLPRVPGDHRDEFADAGGERAELDQAPILVGRGSDAAIRLDDDYVSTRHARILGDSTGGWYVEDLGSTNGTYVGSVRITQPTTLTLGTQVRIGKTVVELRK